MLAVGTKNNAQSTNSASNAARSTDDDDDAGATRGEKEQIGSTPALNRPEYRVCHI